MLPTKVIPVALTAKRLRELLSYDPITGHFHWRTGGRGRRANLLAGTLHHRGYIDIGIDGEVYRAHRLAWLYVFGKWPSAGLDHWNSVFSDNSLANLREADQTENGGNRVKNKNNTSGYKGAHWNKVICKWVATISVNGKRKHIGCFDTPQDAHAAYITEARKVFGVFARAV